jgi:hypothetical protein
MEALLTLLDSANGNATKLAPDNGFTDKALGSIFAVTAGSGSGSTGSSTGSPNSSSTPTTSPEPTAASTSSNHGAIIGGAVGGTLAFLALSGIGILLFRRRRQQGQQPESTLESKDFIGLNSPASPDEHYHPRELEVDANSRWEMMCNANASPVEMPARESAMEMPAGYGQEKQVPLEVRRKKVPGL